MPDFTGQAPAIVNTATAGDQAPPLIAGLAGGGFVVTWLSSADQSIHAQRYDAGGVRVGGETPVANAPGAAVNDVAGVPGGYVVLFTQGGPYGPSSVLAQRVDLAGVPVGSATIVASTTDGAVPLRGAGIEALPDGGWLVTYEREYWPPSPIASATLYAQRFDAGGAVAGAAVTLAQVSGLLVTSTAVLPDGGWITGYNEFANYHDGLIAYAEQFSGSGAIEQRTAINPNPVDTEVAPHVAVLASGTEVVVWWTPDAWPDPGHLQAQLFDATGTPLGAAFDLANADGLLAGSAVAPPQVTALADGGFLVSWEHKVLVSAPAGAPATYSFDLRAQYFDAHGQAGGSPIQIGSSVTLPSISEPVLQWNVLATGDGGFVVAQEQRSAETGLDVSIQKFSPVPPAGPGTTTHTGTAGDDLLVGTAGNDVFDGGAGTDTALLAIALADVLSYSISGGVLTIVAAGGTDTLRTIERVQFTDALFGLDTQPDGHVWQAAALWHVGFGVLPNRVDLSHWTAVADHSGGMSAVANQMIDQYAPGIASADLVSFLYQQLVHEQPSAQTVQSWVDQIGDGRAFATQGDLVAYAASLPLNTDGIAPLVGSIQQLDPAWF